MSDLWEHLQEMDKQLHVELDMSQCMDIEAIEWAVRHIKELEGEISTHDDRFEKTMKQLDTIITKSATRDAKRVKELVDGKEALEKHNTAWITTKDERVKELEETNRLLCRELDEAQRVVEARDERIAALEAEFGLLPMQS